MSVARTHFKLGPYQQTSTVSAPYSNESMTGTTVGAALDWIFSVLYPNTQPSVDTVGDLPAVGNALNDYRVVHDDGDGKAAGYRWEQREGEATPSWHKIHDMDWSSDSILAAFMDATQDLYVHKNGRQDLDENGDPVTGLYEGQTIYGGATAGNLTLNANAGDGTGAESGYVQFDGHTRPTSDNAYDLGTAALRFRDIFFNGALTDGTLSITLQDIDDAINAIVTPDYDTLATKLGTLTVNGDASGSVDLSSSGNKTLSLTVANDSHTHDAATTITNFDSEVYNYLKSGLVDTSEVTWIFDDGLEEITADITVSSVGNIDDPLVDTILAGNAAGDAWVAVPAEVVLNGDVTGDAVYSTADDGWILSTTVSNVAIDNVDKIYTQNKTYTSVAGNPTVITATAHGLRTGETVRIFNGTEINGERTITRIDANSFSVAVNSTTNYSGHYIPQGAQLLYNTNTDVFVVAKEYEEIRLGELSGLDEDVLSYYVWKDGRTGGQTIIGGVSASENLVLESTSNATKGSILVKDKITPNADAAYSGGWSGTDLGSSGRRWNDLYMAGEAKGLRAENVGALPTPSGTEIGRLVYYSNNLYQNNGSSYVKVGSSDISVSTKNANYTATASDDVLLCTGTITITLPAANSFTKRLSIKNIGSGTITIDGDGSETIDGSLTFLLEVQNQSVTLVTDGTGWYLV